MGGSLTIVGTGIRFALQCTMEAKAHIQSADIVLALLGDPIAFEWLSNLNPNSISLQDCYGEGRDRPEAYIEMTSRILSHVRNDKRVCAVFYGHPGVFVTPSHEAIKQALKEGYPAKMLPGISAEDCMFADLEVDPGAIGMQSFEATDFFMNQRCPDVTAGLVLWQIGVVGDRTYSQFDSNSEKLKKFISIITEYYPGPHKAIVYEAATLPTGKPTIQKVTLETLQAANLNQSSTLYVPPLSKPKRRSFPS